jgi:hypothetical protein
VVVTSTSLNGELLDMMMTSHLAALRTHAVFTGLASQISAWERAGLRPSLVLHDVGHSVETAVVTHEYFEVLGVKPRGRGFVAADDRSGAPAVAVISDRLWRRSFEGRENIAGSVVATSHGPVQILGVAPPRFHGARLGEQFDLWIPSHLLPRVSVIAQTGEGADFLSYAPRFVLARLRAGVTPLHAEEAIAQAGTKGLAVRSLHSLYVGPGRLPRQLDGLDQREIGISSCPSGPKRCCWRVFSSPSSSPWSPPGAAWRMPHISAACSPASRSFTGSGTRTSGRCHGWNGGGIAGPASASPDRPARPAARRPPDSALSPRHR